MTFAHIVYDMMQKVNTIAKENKYNRLYQEASDPEDVFNIISSIHGITQWEELVVTTEIYTWDR